MKINGGESLKEKLGVEIQFQEEICRVDQWYGEIGWLKLVPLEHINESEKEVQKVVCGKLRYDFGKCYILHPTSYKLKINARGEYQ